MLLLYADLFGSQGLASKSQHNSATCDFGGLWRLRQPAPSTKLDVHLKTALPPPESRQVEAVTGPDAWLRSMCVFLFALPFLYGFFEPSTIRTGVKSTYLLRLFFEEVAFEHP